jgi:medium-chain acyl-[acyl-carrier-protein] hydrolase
MTLTQPRSRWIVGNPGQPVESGQVRLLCFHHAGGGASFYREWLKPDAFPEDIRVLPVQLPGREDRFREPAFQTMQPLVDALLDNIAPFLVPPFGFFGHSMGALVAFELTRQLQTAGRPLPIHVFLSAKRPPHLTRRAALAGLPDTELTAAVRTLNGTPAEVFEHRELVALMLPILRADFSVSETYPYRVGDPLACPITAFVGTTDPEASETDAQAWVRETREPLAVRVFEGDHFFIQSQSAAVRQAVAEELRRDRAVG